MSRNPLRIAVASALYVLGLGWIVNSNPWSGPTLIHLSESHGVHMNDWVTFALWTFAVAVLFPAYSAGPWRRSHPVEVARFGLTPHPRSVELTSVGYAMRYDRAEDLPTRRPLQFTPPTA
jgi:hypothetical protein